MQHQKCCYCERRIDTFGTNQAVEHYRPRKKYPLLKFTWTNLLLACARCNGKKSDEFPKDGRQPILLDPSDQSTDPEDHIAFKVDPDNLTLVGGCVGKRGSRRGQCTINTIDLDATDHTGYRREYFQNILLIWLWKLLDAIDHNNTVGLNSAKTKFEELMADDAQLAGFVRAFARGQHLHLLGVAIP